METTNTFETKQLQSSLPQLESNGEYWEAISSVEITRLPDYVVQLIEQSQQGELPQSTFEEVKEALQSYFSVANSVQIEEDKNSTNLEKIEIVESEKKDE